MPEGAFFMWIWKGIWLVWFSVLAFWPLVLSPIVQPLYLGEWRRNHNLFAAIFQKPENGNKNAVKSLLIKGLCE